MTPRIIHGPVWLEWAAFIYDQLPWRAIFEWTIILALAFIVAVALLATFQPLYDIAHWKGLL